MMPSERPRRMRLRLLAVPALLIMTAASCGSDDDPVTSGVVPPTSAGSTTETSETPPPSSAAPVSSVVTTLPPVDSEPATTAAPTTSIAATSIPETSDPEPVTWTDVDDYPSGFGQGCCGANSSGPISPELAAAPAQLTNGIYSFDVVDWSPTDPTLLRVSVRAFVPCGDGVTDCSPMDDGTYLPGDIGYSDASRQIDVDLDDSVVVYLGGTDPRVSGDEGLEGILRSTSGRGLADLMSAVADAYDTAIAAPLSAGTPVAEIVADLQANPAHGFTSAIEQMTGELYFSHDGAPPVLFQVVADQGAPIARSGTSALIPRTFTVEDGAISLEFYAGFRS